MQKNFHDPTLVSYSEDCEESQGFSDTFNQFLEKSTIELINRYGIRNKKIIEIGCGKGDFLSLICRLGNNTGIGFDPAYDPGRGEGPKKDPGLTFIKDNYSSKYTSIKGDLICCRMTLEHIQNTYEFLDVVSQGIESGSQTIVYFQVPNMVRILRDCAFEDIYYEHCSYFSPVSLACLFEKMGFKLLNLETVYNNQYIVLEAVKKEDADKVYDPEKEKEIARLEEYVREFSAAYKKLKSEWRRFIRSEFQKKRKTVLWGSGSKAVAFLSGLGFQDEVKYVVDINPHRQGTFMAGTGQEIMPPEFLSDYKPDTVIIMNQIYREEITASIKDLNLSPVIKTL